MRYLVGLIFFLISSADAQNRDKDIFGFATSNTFTYCNIEDSTFLNKVLKINPQILRFPGGAVGNFYHFGKEGYGFDFNEIDKYHSGKFPKRSRGLDKSRNKKNHNYDYIDDFIKLAKRTGAKAVLVANLFIDNDDILLMIEKLKKNNIEIIGVELGSELSNRSYFQKGYTINDYILSAKRCSEKIKNKYPKIKTAIVAAPLVNKKNHRHTIWNSKLSKLDFYDAVIIHSYAKVTKGVDLYGQMLSEESEGENKKEAFDIYKDRALQYLNDDYPKEVQSYTGIFEKPIWVTEWNLQISKTTGNTLLQSLFVSQYILELLSNSALSPVSLTTYHNLGGRDFSGSIFRNNNETLEIQSTYNSFRLLGKIFHLKDLSVKKEVVSDLIFRYTIYSDGIKRYQFVINWSDKSYLNKNKPSYSVIIEKIFGENLFDLADKKGKLNSEVNKGESDFIVDCLPYSLTQTTYIIE